LLDRGALAIRTVEHAEKVDEGTKVALGKLLLACLLQLSRALAVDCELDARQLFNDVDDFFGRYVEGQALQVLVCRLVRVLEDSGDCLSDVGALRGLPFGVSRIDDRGRPFLDVDSRCIGGEILA